jgi:hypothetical protein
MTSSDVITVIDEEPGQFVFGVHRNMTLVVWKGKVTTAGVARLTAVTRKVVAQCPLGFSTIHLVCEGTALPDAETRAAVQQLMTDFAREVACVGVVVGGDGFWASALRATVTGLWQTVPRSFEMRVCGSCDAAATWICPRHLQRTGTALHAGALTEALRTAQQRLGSVTQEHRL